MPFIRIPGVCRLFVVENTRQLAELERHPDVSRVVSPRGGALHRLVATRISRDLRFADGDLPAFQRRDSARRRALQEQLERRLGALPIAGPELELLARFVEGRRDAAELGATVQQWVGKLFSPDYRVTPPLRSAARLLESWPRRDPLSAFVLRASGRLARAKQRLLDSVGGDLYGVHATSLTVPNLIASLERMRELGRDPSLRTRYSPEVIAALSLRAPNAVLRSCTREVQVSFSPKPLPAHTLIIYPLRRLHAGTANDQIAFSSRHWSRCPAHALIGRLLAAVWTASAHASEPLTNAHASDGPSEAQKAAIPLPDAAAPRAANGARRSAHDEPDVSLTPQEP